MPTSSGPLFHFIDTFHLWSIVIVFIVLGVHHAIDLGVHLWFQSLGNVNEAYYAYKARCLENKRRYEQITGEPRRALSHRVGGD